MFSQQITRNGRRIGQEVWRNARASQVRNYASQGKGAPWTFTDISVAPRNSRLTNVFAPASTSTPGIFRRAASMGLVGVAFSTIGAVGTWYAMHSNGMGFHSDEASLTRFAPDHDEAHMAEDMISKHPLFAELRANPAFKESRPHMKMPGSYRARSLTGGALLGPGKMVIPPYAWIEGEGKSLVCVTYVGEDLCGHPGIVHGGYLATMLDEGLARCCFGALPHNIAVTANLNIDYRKPTPAGSFLVLKAETVKVEGRKAWVKGHIETLQEPGEKPIILAEATGLFISPKYAAVSHPFFLLLGHLYVLSPLFCP